MKRRLLSLILVAAFVFISTLAQADNYAVIFSGGYNASNNHDRYYEETLRMWQITTGALGYNVNNVYVLFADGTAVGVDRSSGADSDWSMITAAGGHIGSATSSDLQSTLATLNTKMDSDDTFYFWSFDHGSGGTLDTGELVAWGSTWIRDDEFASWVDPFQAMYQAYAFAQCFAGDMADDLVVSPGQKLFAAWAADYYEYSWGQGWADAWADGLESGLRMTSALGEYAKMYDIYGPNGSGQEHPGYLGDDFVINPTTVVATPEPGTMLLLFAGLAGIVTFRKRFKE